MKTPEKTPEKTVRKRLGMTGSCCVIKRKSLHKVILKSPLIGSPGNNAIKLKVDNENLTSISNVTSAAQIKVKLNHSTPLASSSMYKRISCGLSRNSGKIYKKKLNFIPKTGSAVGEHKSSLEESTQEAPVEVSEIESREKEITEDDMEKLKQEIENLKLELEGRKNYDKQIIELKALIQQWKQAGIDGLETLSVLSDPPIPVEAILKHFNIPPEIYFSEEGWKNPESH